MSTILDTNVVSALMRGDEEAIVALTRAGKGNVAVPHLVFAEIVYGIERLTASRRRDRLRERLDLLLGELPRAPWTDAVSEAFGRVKAELERRGKRIEDFDAAIAAHAVATGATLATMDKKHMARVPGLVVEDWSRQESRA